MRYLLGLMLTLLPVIGHTADSIPISGQEIDQNTAECSIIEQSSGNEHLAGQSWPYSTPYHPSSATNRDVFDVLLLPSQVVHDRSRLNQYQSDSGPRLAVYGHFGSPFSPDSVNRRNEADRRYALESPTIHYGRGWLTEKR